MLKAVSRTASATVLVCNQELAPPPYGGATESPLGPKTDSQGLIYHNHGLGPTRSTTRAGAVLYPFLSDVLIVHLFKSIDLSLKFPVWY
jgi:hypothetical protein